MLTQGALQILYETDLLLREIAGMAAFTLQPMAGAHGELTGMMIMAAYHRDKGNKKTIVLAPTGPRHQPGQRGHRRLRGRAPCRPTTGARRPRPP